MTSSKPLALPSILLAPKNRDRLAELLDREIHRLEVERHEKKMREQAKAIASLTFTAPEAAAIHAKVVGTCGITDWKHPDYEAIEAHRAAALARIRKNPKALTALKLFYKLQPADFINDWGYTWDPRNVEIGAPAKVPFILFPKQREWVDYIMRKWRAQEPGLSEKSRDCGLSWLSVSLGCTICLFHTGVNIGYGSRKAEYVDKIGAPKSLFFKARKFMECLPPEFNGGWNPKTDAPSMRLSFRATDSTMSGEGGDNIGRGDRASIYFVDEAAYLEQPEMVEAALSQTTNCQQDISSVHGSANPFAIKRHSGKVEVFIFDWRDDPRKDDAWYQKQVAELDDVTVAQEIDRNYSASVEGVVIPSAWVRASIDAHKKLGIVPTGDMTGALDVADEGRDLNAFCGAHGILITTLDEWSGKGGDIYETVTRVFETCDAGNFRSFKYDADGLGAGVRGDARALNEKRPGKQIKAYPFRGSGAVFQPKLEDVKGRKNEDFFSNRKAQGWWNLRQRFQTTYRAVQDGLPFNPDDIISISSGAKNYLKLVTELSQPTYQTNKVGKIVIDKTPDGARSPNLADAVMIQFSGVTMPLEITSDIVQRARMRRR